jgi:gamma-glutamylcyclotransferase
MTSAPFVLNFAYGSNMLLARVRERVPSARPVGIAELRGYALRWHKVGADGSAKCDVVATDEPGAVVFGVLFEIPVGEKAALDRAEPDYAERRVVVHVGPAAHDAYVYCATKVDASLKPYSWYRALVVAGAREQQLPAHYVARLESIACASDPDRERHASNMAIVDAVGVRSSARVLPRTARATRA